jgi:hypothetical protein
VMDRKIIYVWLIRAKARLLQLAICFCLLFQVASAQRQEIQTNPQLNRHRGLNMLAALKEVIKNEYYDPHFHGIDLDERFKAAAERVKQMDENWQILYAKKDPILSFAALIFGAELAPDKAGAFHFITRVPENEGSETESESEEEPTLNWRNEEEVSIRHAMSLKLNKEKRIHGLAR